MKKSILILTSILFSVTSWGTERVLSGLSEIKGTTKNYQITNGDGLADFSLVIPAMNAQEIANFDMGRVFSPESDTIKIFSYSLALPSNLSVPKQTESYFMSFTVEKNLFRAYLPSGENFNMYAVRGQFPVSDVIKGVQNKKTLFELVNFFKFYSGGTQNAKAGGATALDIDVNNINFDSTFSLKAPTYGAGKVILALGLVKSNGEYYPTDVKRVASGKTEKLATLSSAQQYALSIVLNDDQRSFEENFNGDISQGIWAAFEPRATSDFTQLSYALQKVTANTTPVLLGQIQAPKFNKTSGQLTAQAPAAVAGINSYATHIVLSEREAGTGIVPVSFRQVLWDTTVNGWQNSFTLPPEALKLIKNKSYTLEVLYLGTDGNSTAKFNWDNVTHVSRNGIIL